VQRINTEQNHRLTAPFAALLAQPSCSPYTVFQWTDRMKSIRSSHAIRGGRRVGTLLDIISNAPEKPRTSNSNCQRTGQQYITWAGGHPATNQPTGDTTKQRRLSLRRRADTEPGR